MAQQFVRLVPACLMMGTIFFLSHQPGSFFSPYVFDWADKLAHLAVYALLCWSLIFVFPYQLRQERKGMVAVVAVIVSLLYGIGDEFHQSFIPGRNPSFSDIAADVAGALVASLLWLQMSGKIDRQVVHRKRS